MSSTHINSKALFFSAIHMDRLGQLEGKAIAGSSNPGTVDEVAGGASLNSASIAQLLGLECSILGLIGEDQSGAYLRQILRERGIGDLLTTIKSAKTGSYTAILEPDGNLIIAMADLRLNEQITPDLLADSYPDILQNFDTWFLNANLSQETLEALSNPARVDRPGILCAASISPAKAQHLVTSLPHLDVLFTNLSEANALIFRDALVPNNKKLDAENCVIKLRKLGVKKGSLSQGGDALWVWDDDIINEFTPSKVDNLVDVTGAGDALAAVFLTGLANGHTMAESAPTAIAAAQATISVKGPYNKNIDERQLKKLADRVSQIT